MRRDKTKGGDADRIGYRRRRRARRRHSAEPVPYRRRRQGKQRDDRRLESRPDGKAKPDVCTAEPGFCMYTQECWLVFCPAAPEQRFQGAAFRPFPFFSLTRFAPMHYLLLTKKKKNEQEREHARPCGQPSVCAFHMHGIATPSPHKKNLARVAGSNEIFAAEHLALTIRAPRPEFRPPRDQRER